MTRLGMRTKVLMKLMELAGGDCFVVVRREWSCPGLTDT